MNRRLGNTVAAAAIGLIALGAAPAANAQVTQAFDDQTACTVMIAPPDTGRVNCSSPATGVVTWDGQTAVDVNLYLPSAVPPVGGFPIIGFYHGWGGSKVGLNAQMRDYLTDGYAVFSQSDRGWGNSCGGTDPKRLTGAGPGGACEEGYNHLMDTRYEVRDAQYLISLLADDGIIDGQKVGATGPSYGGGISMALAALKDRVMLPDDTLIPWESPGGEDMEIAAAAPEIPWTDLAYSLQPNGATLDYVANAPYKGPNGDKRIGVMKQSFVAGLYGLGAATSNYAPPGTDPDADLHTWYASINAGEPYDATPLSNEIIDEITTHHSSYYIDHSTAPAPLLITNGWTDDLFPADEAIRFYNRTRTEHPSAHLALHFRDAGHQRGGTHPGDAAVLNTQQHAWFDHFVKGTGPAPPENVTTLTQTCPNSGGTAAPSAGPFTAPTWAAMAPGEIRGTFPDLQPISPQGGNPQTNQAFDPIAGGGACATAPETDIPGVASYRLPAAPAGGYTLMGSPTIVADIYSPGIHNQIAARLLDVDTVSGDETLVARGLWRPKVDLGVTGTRQVFQLHPNGYRFADGHIPKLELLPNDQPYGRNSNGQAPITVQNLELRLPVLESPGALGGTVQAPAGKVLPAGYALAADYMPDNDADDDGWPDDVDNCPNDDNDTQLDSDGDGIGDACDLVDDDTDNDGVQNGQDNCPNDSNPTQEDTDGDTIGDVCDPSNDDDVDGDGVDNDVDNCRDDSNPGQQDIDGDGIGNACDPTDNTDLDDDGVLDDIDNCPDEGNPGQQDTDNDGVGNACDPFDNTDVDGDGVANTDDNCPNTANAGQQDADADGIGNACDDDNDNDSDGDGVDDIIDNCVSEANAGQQDTDGDGAGDACDATNNSDLDGDGLPNSGDNCPNATNPGQQDSDADGVGNACDSLNNLDFDDDGVANPTDNCRTTGNPSQSDGDGDGIGDACDATDDDPDRDGVMSPGDNCPNDPNAGQQNSDTDGQGDICDSDDDNDGVADSSDQCRTQAGLTADGCPTVPFPGQGGQAGAACGAARVGTRGNDLINGTPQGDSIRAHRGNDVLNGLDGDDCLFGQRGRDTLNGGPGIDQYAGGGGRDSIAAADGVAETVRCGRGRDTVTADIADTLRGCEQASRV